MKCKSVSRPWPWSWCPGAGPCPPLSALSPRSYVERAGREERRGQGPEMPWPPYDALCVMTSNLPKLLDSASPRQTLTHTVWPGHIPRFPAGSSKRQRQKTNISDVVVAYICPKHGPRYIHITRGGCSFSHAVKIKSHQTSTSKFLGAAQTKKGTAYKLIKLHASSWNFM